MEQEQEGSSCVVIEIERISTDAVQGLLNAFVVSKLTRCSQEHFDVTLREHLANGVEEEAAYEKAIHAAVLNEMILEAITDQMDPMLGEEG